MTTEDIEDILTPAYLDSLVELEAVCSGDSTDGNATVQIRHDQWKMYRLLVNLKALYQPPKPPRRSLSSNHPQRMGRYELLDLLGDGGFAVVYLAENQYLARLAAVKIPRPHVLASADLRQRFVREGQAAALLDHPHIVAIYEAGEEGDVPYIAYAFCEGSTLSRWIKQQKEPLSPVVAAEVLRTLADAVHYCHKRGILHRDIKPANVLLQPQQTAGNSPFPFIAKISDFGLAKLIEAEAQNTVTGEMLGTPRYMAPEQTTNRGPVIGAATDVYGLGCVLYELLTGQPPFTAETTWDVLSQVRDYPPAAPRLIRPQIPRDLEIIVLTCLAKAPADRYATAADLSKDLGRFLIGSPIRARPVSIARQFWMWCQHHKAVASLSGVASVMGLLLVIALIVYSIDLTQLDGELTKKNTRLSETVSQLDQALADGKKARQLAEMQARDLRQVLYSNEVARAAEAWKRGDVQAMAYALQPLSRTMGGEDDLREFGWRYLWQQQAVRELFRAKLPARQYSASIAPDGKSVAFAGADSIVRRYSLAGFQLLQELPTEQQEVNSVIHGPAGGWLATAGDDGTVAVWNLPSGQRIAAWSVFKSPAYHVAYSASKDLLLVCGNVPDVHLLDFSTGEQKGMLTGCHTRGVESLSLSPDGRRVLTCSADRTAVVWDLETRTALHQLDGFDYFVSSGAWSPDGRQVAIGALDNRLRVFDVESGMMLAEQRSLDPVQSVAISADGLLLAGDRAGSVTVYRLDPTSRGTPPELAPVARWALHKHRIYGLFPFGGLFATASHDQEVAVFEPQITKTVIRGEPVVPGGLYSTCKKVGLDHLGRTFRIARQGIEVISEDGTLSATLSPDCSFLNLSWKYDRLLATDTSGQLFCWNTTGELGAAEIVDVFPGDGIGRIIPLDRQRVFLQRVFRRQGLTGIGLWNIETKKLEHVWLNQHNVMVSNDGRQFVLADDAKHRLSLLDASTFQEISSAVGHTESINDIAFGRSGTRIYSASTDRTVRVWDAVTLRELLQLRGHQTFVRSMAVSPDERTLASCDDFGSLRLWDLRTGRELYELYRHDHLITWLEFSSDGEELLGIDNELAEFRWSCRPRSR